MSHMPVHMLCVLQARAAELRRQKVEHEKAWAAAQRERELQKVRPAVRCLCWRPATTPWLGSADAPLASRKCSPGLSDQLCDQLTVSCCTLCLPCVGSLLRSRSLRSRRLCRLLSATGKQTRLYSRLHIHIST